MQVIEVELTVSTALEVKRSLTIHEVVTLRRTDDSGYVIMELEKKVYSLKDHPPINFNDWNAWETTSI